MKESKMEGLRRRLQTSVVIAMMLLLSVSMMAMGANQLHWGFGDGEDLPLNLTGQDRGVSYFVDGINGNDAWSGLTWATAKKTIQAAVNVATMGNGDYIFVKQTEYPENVIVNKSNLHIIGEDQQLTHVTSFNVQVVNVEITGFGIGSDLSGTTSVTSTVTNLVLHENVIKIPTSGIGLDIASHYSRVYSNYFKGVTGGGIGIELSASKHDLMIYDNEFTRFAIGIKLTAGYQNFIYNNRFDGRDEATYGIQITSGYKNIISQNWIGYCGTPIDDAGTNNVWLDNHWDGWEGDWTMLPAHGNNNPQTVLSNADIPSEGKVTVRFTFNPAAAGFPAGTVITVRMCHPTYTSVLLCSPSQWRQGGIDQVFPTVEATVDGGKDQFTLTIDTTNTATQAVPMEYQIMDA
ncbi:MAG: right-handed parallel beta-helix repeat-containing protein [Methanomassiliicoccales archaeon]|nr:MAG: right-handed parallel beta-helix repeat-containing protein [Methanomassiliicoccales archaeon]